MYKVILIIGLGNIGSRHFESILEIKNKTKIILCELDDKKLNRLKKNLKKINKNNHEILFKNKLIDFETKVDVAILATSTFKKKDIIKRLIQTNAVDNLIIEKVAFDNIKDYLEILNITNENKIKTFVNFPRREMECYKIFKKLIKNKSNLNMHVHGSNWGLSSNSLHFMDLFNYITDEKLKLINSDFDKKVFKSKRKGYMEFQGKLIFKTNNNNHLLIEDNKSISKQNLVYIYISIGSTQFHIYENKKLLIKISNNTTNTNIEKSVFNFKNQSELTKTFILKLFKNKNLNLPNLKESLHNHNILIDCLNKHLKKNKNKKKLMIT